MKAKTPLTLISAALVTLWAARIPGDAVGFAFKHLRWVPDDAKLAIVFDRPDGNKDLFLKIQAEILFATGTEDILEDFLRLTGEDRLADFRKLLVVVVSTPADRAEAAGIVWGAFGRDAFSGLAAKGKLRAMEHKGKVFYITPGTEHDLALALLDQDSLVFGRGSAVRRILDLSNGAGRDRGTGNAAIVEPLRAAARGGRIWGAALPDWLGFRYDESRLLRSDVHGRSVSRGLAHLRSIAYSVRLSSDAEFRMQTLARDPEDALLLADALRSFLASQRLANKAALAEVRRVLEGARVESAGSSIDLILRLSPQAMERIGKNETSKRILRWQIEAQERELRSDIREIFDLMQIGPGNFVADIGCGLGFFTVRLARVVGGRGRVFAVDIDSAVVGELRKRVLEAPFPQVEVILGEPADPKLVPGALDAALIFNSYHEMTEYSKMLEHTLKALKPGGRLLLIEPFSPARRKDSRESQVSEHVLAPEIAEEELRRAGFEILVRNDEFVEQREAKTYEWLILARRSDAPADSNDR